MKREIMDQEVMNRLRKFGDQRKQELIYLKELNLNALKQKSLKKLTILHSNDLHGDFLAAQVDSELVGGVSMLSGYINMVRNEEKMSSTRLPETCSGDPSLTASIRESQLLRS